MVVLDYKMNFKYYSFDNLKPETICLHKLNMPYEDIIKTFKDKFILKVIDNKYVMNNKDVEYLDTIIGLACIAMGESEKNNKQLKTKNEILEIKCANFDRIVKERNQFKSELDEIMNNLCVALGRSINDKKDIIYFTNIYAALFARENENQYILMENDKSKYTLNKQLINICVKTLNNYDEILSFIDKFKEELYIKNLKISQLLDDLCLIKAENKEKNDFTCLLQKQNSDFSHKFVDKSLINILDHNSQHNNELYKGKMLIIEQINQLEGTSNIEIDNYELIDLFNMFMRSILDKEEHLETINKCCIQGIEDQNQQLIKEINDHKEWQKHLENENEKLSLEIEDYKQSQKILRTKENEHNNLKENYLKMQCMYDNLCKENAYLKTSIIEYQHQLSEKNIKSIDDNNLIKILQSNLTEQSKKIEQANSMYFNEKEKCQKIETNIQQTTEEFIAQINEKNSNIASIQDECLALKYHINLTEIEVNNLKQNIISLEYELNEKNKTLQAILKTRFKEQQNTTQLNDLLHILSILEQQMDIVLNDLNTCKKKIINYESVLKIMQNTIQQQTKTRNEWIAEHKYIKDKAYKKLLEKEIKDKKNILHEHQIEVEYLKSNSNLNATHFTEIISKGMYFVCMILHCKILNLYILDTNFLKNEIQNLKENLKLNSSLTIVTENIAYFQLKEASKMIQHLIRINTIQVCDLIQLSKKILIFRNINYSCSIRY